MDASKIVGALSGLTGLFDHYDSKKLAAVVKGIFAQFAVLGFAALNRKYNLGVSDGDIQAASAGIAGICGALILGQSYADAKTNGATSGIQQTKPAPAAGTGAAPSSPALMVLVAGALLFGAGTARADDAKLPPTLCAIGSQGNFCFGILPTVSGPGVDVRHGVIVDSFQVGTSLAATWMPGQLKSVTLGVHAGIGTGNTTLPRTYNLGGTLSFLKGYATLIVDWQAVGGDHAIVVLPAFGIVL